MFDFSFRGKFLKQSTMWIEKTAYSADQTWSIINKNTKIELEEKDKRIEWFKVMVGSIWYNSIRLAIYIDQSGNRKFKSHAAKEYLTGNDWPTEIKNKTSLIRIPLDEWAQKGPWTDAVALKYVGSRLSINADKYFLCLKMDADALVWILAFGDYSMEESKERCVPKMSREFAAAIILDA